ncbi:HPP family protein [Coprinopsis sp. MPI-PUGE-AT-0042]|nr:HPP family protein [Coprinopsis sp. MPI-PUGE-AT-0042]
MRQSRLARLPKWLSFWLGYRETPPPPQPPYIVWFWPIFGHVPYFINMGVPSIGATAVLIYGAIESPLAQPRPVMGGHLFSAFIGICITKLFLLLHRRKHSLEWMTGTTHPPAGATALLAAINPDIRRIGWFYIPVVLMVSTIAIIVALFTNNMQRQYPTFWWAPDPPPSTPVGSEPPTPTDSTVVSRRASLESFDGLTGCHARSLEKELEKHVDDEKVSSATM